MPTASNAIGPACATLKCAPKTNKGTAIMPPPAPVRARIKPIPNPRIRLVSINYLGDFQTGEERRPAASTFSVSSSRAQSQITTTHRCVRISEKTLSVRESFAHTAGRCSRTPNRTAHKPTRRRSGSRRWFLAFRAPPGHACSRWPNGEKYSLKCNHTIVQYRQRCVHLREAS